MTEYETLKRTFHNAANQCHQNGISFTLVGFRRICKTVGQEERGGLCTQLGLAAWRDAPPPLLGADDGWPILDDPDSDERAEFQPDSEVNDTETTTTTTAPAL